MYYRVFGKLMRIERCYKLWLPKYQVSVNGGCNEDIKYPISLDKKPWHLIKYVSYTSELHMITKGKKWQLHVQFLMKILIVKTDNYDQTYRQTPIFKTVRQWCIPINTNQSHWRSLSANMLTELILVSQITSDWIEVYQLSTSELK